MTLKSFLFCNLLLTLLNLTFALENFALLNKNDVERTREAKLFSLFNVVRFRNDPCTTREDGLTGTCMSSTECQSAGGIIQGNCAAGEHDDQKNSVNFSISMIFVD